jgi:hypothetical protein
VTDDLTKRDLPVPDYDQLQVGALSASIASLDRTGVEQLLAYEQSHAARLPVVQLLEHRLDRLDSGQEPSEARQGESASKAPPPDGGSMVSPATQGPPVNPPSQGDPTNPAQPRG